MSSNRRFFDPFGERVPVNCYAAFVDVLGFSARILDDFDQTFELYMQLIEEWHSIWKPDAEVSVSIYSDAVIVTSLDITRLVVAINGLTMATMLNSWLVRGGVAFGKHVEVHDAANVYVASESLTRAVGIEKAARYPCVGLDDSVEVPAEWWDPDLPNLYRPALCFEGIRLVNPFGPFWFRSAAGRVEYLASLHPEHREEHEWFLRLYEAVVSSIPLVPSARS